jgi:hypothetical protein
MPENTGARSRSADSITSALLPLNAPFNAVKTTGSHENGTVRALITNNRSSTNRRRYGR